MTCCLMVAWYRVSEVAQILYIYTNISAANRQTVIENWQKACCNLCQCGWNKAIILDRPPFLDHLTSSHINIFHIRSAPAFRHSATASWSCFPVPLREVKEALMGWYLHRPLANWKCHHFTKLSFPVNVWKCQVWKDSTSIKCKKNTSIQYKYMTHTFPLCLSTLNSCLRCWWVWNLHPYVANICKYMFQLPCLTHHWCPWICSITGDTWTASTPAGPKTSRHSNCTSTCGQHPCSAWLHQIMIYIYRWKDVFQILVEAICHHRSRSI